MTPPVCARTGCGKPGLWQPGLQLWAKGFPKSSHRPARGFLKIWLCSEHKAETTIDKLLPGDGKKRIEDSFRQAGVHVPAWDTAELVWQSLS